MSSSEQAIKIDIAKVLAERLGRRSRLVPRVLVRAVERLIHQDELNELLEKNFPLRGADFCEGVLRHLDVSLDVRGADKLPESPRCIIVSNHPLGGLDGITMIAWLSRHYGRPVHFVVNDLLMAVEPLGECFVPINKHGAQSRGSAAMIDAVLAGDDPVVIYPAGLVSRLGSDGTIADLEWRKMVVNKAIESRRDIVPVHFGGSNSPSFYRWARRRKRLGLKFNFEMVLLPREMFRARGKTFTLTCGKPVRWQSLQGGRNAAAEAAALRSLVYSLPKQNSASE
ncbi:MAG: 1-acyl-sn-glycerol-3-phosphate acyltransferase [Muribaculaceae bacterium]|nr:1-acyl-sn-glycerol-3-phosphate acyltransferase [Muribaculaceae bacterium]